MSTHRRSAFALPAVLALLAVFASACPAEEIRLRCRWTDPVRRQPLDMVFAGNPMLVTLPGDTLEITAAPESGTCQLTLIKDGKPFREDSVLSLSAPEKPGSYYIPISVNASGGRRESQVCVLVVQKATGRRASDGLDIMVDGLEIGHYRNADRSGSAKVRDNPESYLPPAWWLRLTEQNCGFEIVPGLCAMDLVAPSEDTGTRHTDLVPVCYPMWLAVDVVRKGLESRGIPGSAMKLISQFRTPPYNRGIGSNATSRHVYGDAFDFYIDLDGKGKAADLNRDGKLDRRDAYPIVALLEDLQAEGKLPMGGIGIYNTIGGDHEVTLHLDLRGHRATWGFLYPAPGKTINFSWQSRHFAELDRQEEMEAADRAAKEGRKYSPPHREPLP